MRHGAGRYQRKNSGQQHYRPRFVVATEGSETEKNYLVRCFGGQGRPYTLDFAPSDKASAPKHVLKRMQVHLKKKALRKGDEAWILVDRDDWPEQEIIQLEEWACAEKKRFLALSNPKFEYWLLLHFEEGSGLKGPNECDVRLLKYWPQYTKSTDNMSPLVAGIRNAVANARRHDTPPCNCWPRSTGTTVYRLVERLLQF